MTGVDFSHEAVLLARRITAETGVEAEFVESDVIHLASVLDREFDIVFSSYGALCWLPDLRRWADAISNALVDGGFLYLVDDHPLASIADEKSVGRICSPTRTSPAGRRRGSRSGAPTRIAMRR